MNGRGRSDGRDGTARRSDAGTEEMAGPGGPGNDGSPRARGGWTEGDSAGSGEERGDGAEGVREELAVRQGLPEMEILRRPDLGVPMGPAVGQGLPEMEVPRRSDLGVPMGSGGEEGLPEGKSPRLPGEERILESQARRGCFEGGAARILAEQGSVPLGEEACGEGSDHLGPIEGVSPEETQAIDDCDDDDWDDVDCDDDCDDDWDDLDCGDDDWDELEGGAFDLDEDRGRDAGWTLDDPIGVEYGEAARQWRHEARVAAAFRQRERVLMRERAVKLGPCVLSDLELLALIVGTGTKDVTAAEVADELLRKFGGLGGLGGCSPRAFARQRGLGAAKACRVAAAVELGRRVMARAVPPRPEVHEPEDLRPLLCPLYHGRTRESFHVVLLNARNGVIDVQKVAEGTVDACVLHPREVFRLAIEAEASGIVLAHNHPSGNPQPSCEDLNLTERFRRVARALGIKLMDHVIVAGEQIVSIRALGLWDEGADFLDVIEGVTVHEPSRLYRPWRVGKRRKRRRPVYMADWLRALATERALRREARRDGMELHDEGGGEDAGPGLRLLL